MTIMAISNEDIGAAEQAVAEDLVRDHINSVDAVAALVPAATVELARAVNTQSLADEIRRHEAACPRPRLNLTDDEIERLREDSVAHAMAVIGVFSEGRPQVDEALSLACTRVARARGVEHVGLALRMAGTEAIQKAGGADKLGELLDSLPDWLSAYTMMNLSRYSLWLPMREHDVDLDLQSGIAALRCWPNLPPGPCILEPE